MNVEDILKGFGRLLGALEELKATDPLEGRLEALGGEQ